MGNKAPEKHRIKLTPIAIWECSCLWDYDSHPFFGNAVENGVIKPKHKPLEKG